QLFDQTVQVLLTALEYGISHATCVQGNCLGGVVVAGNDVVDAVWRVVGINNGHNGNTQRAGFGDGNFMVAHVDDKQCVGQRVHVFDAAYALVQFLKFALEHQRFFLAHALGCAFGNLRFHFFQALDRGLDGFEVGHHATQPTAVDIRHAAARGFGGRPLKRCVLVYIEQYAADVGSPQVQVV